MSDTESKASSLNSSAAGRHSQDPTEFAQFLASGEMGYDSNFSFWRTTDEDQESAPTTRIRSILFLRDPDFSIVLCCSMNLNSCYFLKTGNPGSQS